MYCEKCGKPVEEGRTYCVECAMTSISEEPTSTTPAGIELNWEGNVESKKSSGKGKIIAIVVAVIAVLGVLVALLWKPIAGLLGFGNQFESAQEHFAYVEGKTGQNLADGIAAGYGDLIAAYDSGLTAAQTQITLHVNEMLMDSLSEYSEMDLSWLNDVVLTVESNGDMQLMQYMLTVGLGDTDVMSVDFVYNLQEYMMWMGLPELSATYLEIDMSEFASASEEGMITFNASTLREMLDVLPSEQILRNLLNRYIKIAVSNIHDVTGKTNNITINGVSQECTILEAKIDQETLNNIAIAVLKEAKEDEELLGVICDILEYAEPGSGDIMALEWAMGIDAAIARIEESSKDEAPSEALLTLIDYVDSDNNIIGRGITSLEMDGSVYYLKLTEGNKFAYELNLLDEIVLSGNGTNNNNLINGEFVLEASGMECIVFELINFDGNKLKKNECSGTLRARLSDDMMEMAMGAALNVDVFLDINLDISNSHSAIDLKLLISNQEIASVAIESQQKEATSVQVPSNSISVYDETALENWVKNWNFDEILNNIADAGLPSEYVYAMEEYLQTLLEDTSY